MTALETVGEYAVSIRAAAFLNDQTAANRATHNLLCEPTIYLMDTIYLADQAVGGDAKLRQRCEHLTDLVAQAIDAWNMAQNWPERCAAADMVIRAYWEVRALEDPGLPHAVPGNLCVGGYGGR